LIAGLGVAVAYLALAALGPVTNYDSGLYHLGAIKYAGDYATIPGLANLYFPFGYNTSLYPVGAFLGNGPWGSNGYRLVNGFLILLVVLDLVLRLVRTHGALAKKSVGTYFLLIAVPLTLIPLVSLSDYWVTSPSSDAAVLVLTVISVAYLLDALTKKTSVVMNSSVSFVTAVIAFSMRPTMVVFLLVSSVVLLYRLTRIQQLKASLRLLTIPAFIGIVLLFVQSTRDYLLSGWLQYPLSLVSFNVPWQAVDPVDNRAATLGNARNPGDIWGSVEGFAWVGPYLSRLPSQWETFFVLALIIIMLVLIFAAKLMRARLRWRTILVAELPVLAAVITWFFFSPPTFRFGWGPVFSLFFIPIAFALKALFETSPTNNPIGSLVVMKKKTLLPALGVTLILLVGFNTATRFQFDSINQEQKWSLGPVGIKYSIAPVIDVPIIDIPLKSGLVVTSPTQSDQCWDNYPLCTAIPLPSLQMRGDGITQGFLP
jgi:hypothetical protein